MKFKWKNKIKELNESAHIALRLLKVIWSFDKKIVIGQFFVTGTQAAIPFINAYIYALIIDLIVRSIGKPFNYTTLATLLSIRFASLLVQYGIYSIQSYIDLVTWSKLPIFLYQLILGKIAGLDIEYFEDAKFRDMLQKVRESYAWMPLNMYTNIFGVFQSVFQMTLAFVAISTLSIFLAGGIVIAAIPAFLNQIYYSKTLWGVWDSNSPHKKKVLVFVRPDPT